MTTCERYMCAKYCVRHFPCTSTESSEVFLIIKAFCLRAAYFVRFKFLSNGRKTSSLETITAFTSYQKLIWKLQLRGDAVWKISCQIYPAVAMRALMNNVKFSFTLQRNNNAMRLLDRVCAEQVDPNEHI